MLPPFSCKFRANFVQISCDSIRVLSSSFISMINFTIILDKRHVGSKGESSVKFAFHVGKQTALLPTGIKIMPEHWDNRTRTVVSHPSRKTLNVFLLEQRLKVENALLDLQASSEHVGLSAIEIRDYVDGVLNPTEANSNRFVSRFRRYSSNCRALRTREIYNATIKKVLEFDPKAERLKFDDVTKVWLTRFDEWLCSNGCPSRNARNIHLRNIRAVFNEAIDDCVTSSYPFRKFKIRPEATAKRSLTIEQLRFMVNGEVDRYLQRYRDFFMLSFSLIGINVVDLLNLRKENLCIFGDGESAEYRIRYVRHKTKRVYDVKVEPEALAIMRRYPGNEYLLNFIEGRKSYRSFTYQVDLNIKRVLPSVPSLSTYWARHSWASIASELDVPVEVISHALGHGYGNRTTAIYIDFNQRKVDEANRRVLDWVYYNKR